MGSFSFGVNPGPQEYTFSNVSIVVITHNLGYNPLVYVVVDNELCFCQVDFNDVNQVTLTFQNSLTGVAYIR